ncbi:MAG TPA: response regulator, partial [Acidimicrobiales bacterium]|nr:response regulator [Acidimicrobiales bacterium]
VQRIVDSHGGTVELQSTRGLGTTITVYLRRPEGRRLLVADDDEGTRETVAEVLRHAGYTVAEAGDGAEALAVLHASDVDLVVLDLRMPVIDGWTVLAHLERSGRDARSRPAVVIATGETLDENGPASLERSGVTVLRKPVAPEVLLSAVARTLTAHEPIG